MKDWVKATYNNWHHAFSMTSRSFKEEFSGRSLKQVISDYIQDIKVQFSGLSGKLHDLRGTNYKLGMEHYERGNFPDAIFRFKMLKRFYPDMKEADYFIARSYFENGNENSAKQFISEYLKSQDQKYRVEAEYTYDVLENRVQNIQVIPTQLAKHTFDVLSYDYDAIYLSSDETPQNTMFSMINSYCVESGSPFGHISLDIGCGTGYIGRMLKSAKIASVINGLDISPRMIEICNSLKNEGLKVYDQCYEQDFDSFILSYNQSTKFSIITISNFLLYYSKLDTCLNYLKPLLSDKGLIAITYKTSLVEGNVSFDPYMEEFRYNDEYVAKVIGDAGLQIQKKTEVTFVDGDKGFCMLLIK